MHDRLDPALFRPLLAEAAACCACAEASLWAAGPEASLLRVLANHGPDAARLEGAEVPIDGSLVGWAFLSGQELAVGRDAAYDRRLDQQTGRETVAMAAVPVRTSEGVLGVLSAINPEGRETFGPEDLRRLGGIAARAAELMAG